MPMYNLLEYSSNYSGTTGSLWFYSQDGATNLNADIENTNAFKSFKYKAKFLGDTVAQPAPNQGNGILKNATIVVPLKYLCKFLNVIFKNYVNVNWNLDGKSISFFVCLVMKMIMLMLILIILFLLSNTQNCMFLYPKRQSKTIRTP